MSSPATVGVVTPAPRQAWAEVLSADPSATVFQTPGWVDAMCHTGHYTDVSRLYLTDRGPVVLPLVRRTGVPPALAVEASPPAYWSTGGIVAPGGSRADDVSVVWRDLLGRRIGGARIRPHYHARAAWQAATPRTVRAVEQCVHVLDLSGGYDEVWRNRFSSSVRRAVRKAEGAHLDVEIGSSPRLAAALHQLYVTWLRQRAQDRGLPAAVMLAHNPMHESRRKFAAVASAVGDGCRFLIARRDGELVAGMVLLMHGDHASYWRGYSDRRLAGPTRANNLLQNLAIQEACARGCRSYNMGESGAVPSLVEFKTRHGAVPWSFQQYEYERLPYRRLAQLRFFAEGLIGRALARPAEAASGTVAGGL